LELSLGAFYRDCVSCQQPSTPAAEKLKFSTQGRQDGLAAGSVQFHRRSRATAIPEKRFFDKMTGGLKLRAPLVRLQDFNLLTAGDAVLSSAYIRCGGHLKTEAIFVFRKAPI
jgi:hypothetical protein